MDTVVRLADYYVHYLNVVAVLCLVPESNRFELFVDGEPVVQSAMDHSPQFGLWVLDARNARTNQEKNLLAVGKICDTVNVPFIHIFSEHMINQKSKARDLQHYGHETQCAWADQFITGYDVARKKN